MNNTRSAKKQPFCWQEKKVLRLLRCQYEGKEHDKLRNLYLTLTEIYSDFNGQDIKYYTQWITVNKVDSKITGAYMLGEYGISDTLTSGVIIGGNKLKSDLSNGSKVDGDALYIGAYVKKYIGNLKVTAGAGFQYGDYDTDRLAVNRVASSIAKPVMKYSDNYNDMTYDIYLNGRYSNPIGDNLFLESYATLSYTYIKQDGANEGSKALAIETDSKSFDYTVEK